MDRQGETSLQMMVGPARLGVLAAPEFGGPEPSRGPWGRPGRCRRREPPPECQWRTRSWLPDRTPLRSGSRTPGLRRDGTRPSLLSPSGEAILAPHL